MDSNRPAITAACGAVLTLLMAFAAWLLWLGRRRAESRAERIAVERDRLALLADHTSHPVMFLDRQHRVSWANAVFERLTGYSAVGAVGQPAFDALRWNDANPRVQAAFEQALAQGGGFKGVVQGQARDGRLYWFDLDLQPRLVTPTPTPSSPGGVPELLGYVAIGTDITELRGALAQQQAAQRTAARLLSTIQDQFIVSVADPAGRIIEVNDAFCRISGYAREALIGHNHRVINSGEHEAGFWADMWQAIVAGRSWRGEVCNRARDGTLYWVDSVVAPLMGDDGQIEKFVSIRTNISDRKATTRALADERQRLAAILEGTQVGTWEINFETHEMFVNERWASLLGRARAELAPISQQTWIDNCHPDDLARAEGLLQRHLADAQVLYDLELRMRHKDGHWVWVLSRGRVSRRGEDGRPLWMAGTHQDISARKAAELALRDSEAFLDRASRIAGMGGWQFDTRDGSMSWSAQLCRMHGLEASEVTDLPQTLSFYSGSARTQLEEAFMGAVESGLPWDIELPINIACGRMKWVRSMGEAEQVAGRTLRIFGAVQDITERRQIEADRQAAETERSRAQALLRGAIEAVNEAFVLFDPDDRLVFCNDKYRAIYAAAAHLIVPGATFEDIVRGGAELGQYAAANGRVEAWVAERLALHRRAHSQTVQQLETGTWLRVIERRMPDGHTVGFRIDITDLVKATQAAENASQSKSQFLANMSHELRTPMNAVLGMLKLLQRTDLSPRQLDYASKSEGAAQSLLGLLNDILDFSKVEAGRMTLDPHPFRFDHLMRDVEVILQANMGHKPLDLRFEFDAGLPLGLVGDATRLRQVLINLGGNALKFTDSGEVVVQVRVLAHEGAEVLLGLSVRDTGMGITAEQQAHIFDGFSQAEASTTRRFGGTGLGLAICRSLVALMGGDLQVHSVPGQGSRFEFQLPLRVDAVMSAAALMPVDLHRPAAAKVELPAMQGTAAMPACADGNDSAPMSGVPIGAPGAPGVPGVPGVPGAAQRPLAGLRLLVVEDNANNQQVARELLEDEGAWVQLADNGQQGVDAVAESRFDAVLMDVQMPVMDGYTATAMIRQRLGLGSLPIIAMTANAMPSDVEACLGAGMNEHIGKPFDLRQLIEVLLRLTARPQPRPSKVSQLVPVVLPPGLAAQAAERGFDLAPALERCLGKVAIYQRMLNGFAIKAQQWPDELAGHLAAKRRPDAAMSAHSLKGLAATLGINRLADLMAGVEHALFAEPDGADAQRVLAVRQYLSTAVDDVNFVVQGLQGLVPETPASPPPLAKQNHPIPGDTA